MAAVESDGVSAPLPGRCAFYVAKKKRYCKMVVGNGKKFCGEHAVCFYLFIIYRDICILSNWLACSPHAREVN